jgi:hypothetical protein
LDQRTAALLGEAVRRELSDWGEVRPPYVAFPGIDPFHIAWRMCAGEWHIMVWSHWWSQSHRDEPSRLAYFRRHPPPTQWLYWSATAIWPEMDDDDVGDDFGGPAVRQLASHGIGTYADWWAWINDDDA